MASEPVDTSADPHLGAERGEALGFAVLLLLERLSPNERAAYVLREAFDYPYRQIADILRLSEPGVRQLVSRARKHVLTGRRAPVSGAEQRRLLEAFVAAARSGDLAALEELFAQDVTSYSDGGGVVRASRVPVVGVSRVAKYVRAFADRFWDGVEVAWGSANGQAAALLHRDGAVFTVLTVNASAQGIDQVLWMMNPAKITAVSAAA
ncbi:sigma factor-like helix-turn-helix DNA-binding protein [Nonomuraea sp. NPDC000554]|uniref:sigma factor-like helix-turn-helix DNA-binding protein n=1 Tax=Nonomuraea sp. NPDC000554 TaxID=3154259 RepID=UPI00332AB98A